MAEFYPDRRKKQRVDANLNLKVKLPVIDNAEEAASLETINISSSGVYFKSTRYIEPMTKLDMDIELSVPGPKGSKSLEKASINCEGIVVRVTPESGQPEDGYYEVAVFFTNIAPKGLQALEDHITLLLETV